MERVCKREFDSYYVPSVTALTQEKACLHDLSTFFSTPISLDSYEVSVLSKSRR